MNKIVKTLLLMCILVTTTKAQNLHVGGTIFANKSHHIDSEDDISYNFISANNVEAFVKYQGPFLLGLESGLKLTNVKNTKFPDYYLVLPVKLFWRSHNELLNMELGAGVFQGIALAKEYNNTKGLSASFNFYYDFNPRMSMFFKVEFTKFLDRAYTSKASGPPGVLGGGRQYGYFVSSRSLGFGLMFQLLKEKSD